MNSENVSRGIRAFNAGDPYEAHEDWEQEWKSSTEPARTHLKALIQVCGVLVHLQKGRWDPARRLALRALELFAEARAHERLHGIGAGHGAGVDIPGAEAFLLKVAAALSLTRAELGRDAECLPPDAALQSELESWTANLRANSPEVN